MIDTVLILGNSKKFILESKKIFKNSKIVVVPWRDCEKFISNERDFKKMKISTCIVCGYNHKSALFEYSKYYKLNVENPFLFLKNNIPNSATIIYIDTLQDSKNITFSRYKFAKRQLANMLTTTFKKFLLVSVPLVVNKKNKADINSDIFSKFIFNFMISIGIIKTINMKKVGKLISYLLRTMPRSQKNDIKGIFLKVPRFQFIDRVLRLTCG